MLLANNSRTN